MSILGRGLVLAGHARAAQRRLAARNPRRAQEASLASLVRRAEMTSFGQRYGFSGISSVKSFQARVPLRRYEDLKPWFEQALAGNKNVTWPGKIRYFGMTSGTTAGNKYLPISADSVRQQQRGGFEPIASYLSWTRDSKLLDGKVLMLGGSPKLEERACGVLVGDNTGVMARHVPRALHGKYLPSATTRGIANWDDKIREAAREAVAEDVRMLVGTPAWFPGLFDRVLGEAKLRGKGADTICDVWPNLSFLTGGGVAYEPYRGLIEARLGRRVPYVETYSATEGGILGVQDDPRDPSMLLLPDNGIFYEFVPEADVGLENPRRYTLWEVEKNAVYAIAVTTMSGIFAYLIGDCLRFTSVFPHRVLFEGRTAAFVNVQGEHVSQGELERAVLRASRELAARLVDFTLTTEVGIDGSSAARHVYWLELEGPTPDLVRFAQVIDCDIAAQNDDYEVHRGTSHGLHAPDVRVVPRGTFHEWMRTRGKLGGQNKIPRLILREEDRALLQKTAENLGNGTRT
ncbi:MAG: GH3 auxin-responsive promoter family protein [Polyangiaceae bacterium]|nr:GH3 auxin-responsive promoter family protein [Polyangiaceae bacterium]